MIFQGLSVARNCLRPEAAHLTILAIKRRLLYNSPKTFNGHSFMRYNGTSLKFSILNLQNLDLNKRGHYFKVCFIFKVPPF